MKTPVVTWTEQGIPFAETRARMPERDDMECYSALAYFTANGLLKPQRMRQLGDLASRLQSTKAVLNAVEPALRASLVKRVANLSALSLDALVEMYALTIEAFVRQAKKLAVKA